MRFFALRVLCCASSASALRLAAPAAAAPSRHSTQMQRPPRSRPVVCAEPLTVAAELAGGAGLASLGLRWLYGYLTVTLVGPRPRGGTLPADVTELERLAHMEPREVPWSAEELAAYDGSSDATGPILLGAGGLVFNVGKARRFYGPGAEYSTMAGRDA
eukprot:5685110-Prymnesium_polylepis.1